MLPQKEENDEEEEKASHDAEDRRKRELPAVGLFRPRLPFLPAVLRRFLEDGNDLNEEEKVLPLQKRRKEHRKRRDLQAAGAVAEDLP